MTARTAHPARARRTARAAADRKAVSSARSARSARSGRSAPSARSGPSAPSAPVALAPQLVLDENPRRAVTSINVRHDDKALFDRIQAWCSLERGRTLSQWETFTLLVVAALPQLPAELRERLQ